METQTKSKASSAGSLPSAKKAFKNTDFDSCIDRVVFYHNPCQALLFIYISTGL